MLRTTLIASAFALTAFVSAENTPTCDTLDRSPDVQLHDNDIDLDGQDLVLKSSGRELIHIDARRNLFVEGRPITVPNEARPHLDAYMEAQAEMLCRSVVALQHTERELQQRIPAFPAFIAPVNPAL